MSLMPRQDYLNTLSAKGWKFQSTSSRLRSECQWQPALPLKAEGKFLAVWAQMNEGMRWMLLDLLRRYSEMIRESDDLAEADGWARMHFPFPGRTSITGNGNFHFRLMPPNKTRKGDAFIKLSFVNSGANFSCWPGYDEPLSNKALPVTLKELLSVPIARRSWPSDGKQATEIDIDPAAQSLVDLIPQDLRADVIGAIIEHGIEFHMTNSTGAAAMSTTGMGITGRRTKNRDQIVLIGTINEFSYFQNGWLMIKLAKLPAALHDCFESGRDAGTLLDVAIKDGRGGILRPFDGMKISKTMRGNTWMGPHVQLQFRGDQDV